MSIQTPIPFWKLSGSGNDFILIDHRKPFIAPGEMRDLVSKLCRRGMSVGADGVILIQTSERADYDWHYFNADGGEVEMCANGSRCAARFAFENKIAPASHRFETLAGIVGAEVQAGTEGTEARVRIQLPDPFDLHLNREIEIEGEVLTCHSLNTGVPHVVYFVEDVDQIDLIRLGRATRHHPLLAPEGTNANFVSFTDRHHLKIRTYERGVENETLACGTGSLAAGMIAAALDKAEAPLFLETRSGIVLGVDFKQNGLVFQEVFLEGDARIVYKGTIEPEAFL